MTATRDRRSEVAAGRGAVRSGALPWDERAAFGTGRGLVWWAAVLLAFVLTFGGALVDYAISSKFGKLSQGTFALGCVISVLWVQRKSLFGPMVQPPLLMIVSLAGVTLAMSKSSTGGASAKVLDIGTPLISSFPVMAGVTIATVVIGVIRMTMQKKPRTARRPAAADRPRREPQAEPAPRPAARAPQPQEPPARPQRAARPGPPPPTRVNPPVRGSQPPPRGGRPSPPPRQQPPPRRPPRPDDDYRY